MSTPDLDVGEQAFLHSARRSWCAELEEIGGSFDAYQSVGNQVLVILANIGRRD
jgi:hypothetical protein